MDANSSKLISLAAEREKRLLRKLSFRDRRLVEGCMAHHPSLTAPETIEHLDAFGALSLTAEARELLAKFGGE